MKKIMITILVLFIFVIVYSFSHQTQMVEYFCNKNKTQECKNHADATAEFQQWNTDANGVKTLNKFYGCFNSECQTVAIGTCFSADECDGQPMAVIQCTGQWTCEKSGAPYGRCKWVCS